MKSIAIITARGGSKRIPGKNIKEFCGKPIIAYSIEAAINSNLFETVMVSTDDDVIVNIARKYGAEVPFLRSKKNSDDFATTVDVLKEVLMVYKDYDYFCCLYPTAPFVTTEKLRDSFNLFHNKNADTLIPVVEFSFPPQRGFKVEEGYLSFISSKYENMRSQDLDKVYHDVGQFYWGKVNQFLKSGKLVTDNTVSFEINAVEAQDIDNEADWQIAEIKYKYIKAQSNESNN